MFILKKAQNERVYNITCIDRTAQSRGQEREKHREDKKEMESEAHMQHRFECYNKSSNPKYMKILKTPGNGRDSRGRRISPHSKSYPKFITGTQKHRGGEERLQLHLGRWLASHHWKHSRSKQAKEQWHSERTTHGLKSWTCQNPLLCHSNAWHYAIAKKNPKMKVVSTPPRVFFINTRLKIILLTTKPS